MATVRVGCSCITRPIAKFSLFTRIVRANNSRQCETGFRLWSATKANDFLRSSTSAVLLTHNFYIKTILFTTIFMVKYRLILLVSIYNVLWSSVYF